VAVPCACGADIGRERRKRPAFVCIDGDLRTCESIALDRATCRTPKSLEGHNRYSRPRIETSAERTKAAALTDPFETLPLQRSGAESGKGWAHY